VKVFSGAISDSDGEITVHDIDALSSASTETIEAHSKIEWSKGVKI